MSWCEGRLVGSLLDCMRHEGSTEVIQKSARYFIRDSMRNIMRYFMRHGGTG